MVKHPEIIPRVKFDLSLVREFDKKEIEEAISVAEKSTPFSPFIISFRERFGEEGMIEIAEYVLTKYIPRPYYEFWKDLTETATRDNVSIETSDSVREVTEYVLKATSVSDAKSRINKVMQKYVGISSYVNPLLGPLAYTNIPYPPERFGTPTVLTLNTSWEVIAFDADVAQIKPSKNVVFGPLLETDKPIKVECRFIGNNGIALTILWVLFEMRWCWWVWRIWLPFLAGFTRFEKEGVIRFRWNPDRIRTFAARIHPVAINVKNVMLRRIA